MKSLHFVLFSSLICSAINAAPKLTYIQRPDERAPFIYITVHNDDGSKTTHKRNELLHTSPQGVTRATHPATTKNDDIVVYPTGSKIWNWHSHIPHTSHRPGTLPVDVKELVEDHKVDIVILSRGVEEVLQIDPSTIEYLKKHNKEYYILETRQAINKYNELVAQGKNVGGLFHTTC